MMWSGSGGWWFFAIPLIVICMFMMMRMGHGHGSHSAHTGEPPAPRFGGPERILAERLARGEIDIEEYERRVAALRSANEVGQT